MRIRAGLTLRGGVRALATALLFSGAAHAAIYTGSWDPNYGPSLPFLGFRGQASFFVPDACLGGGPNAGTFVSNGNACSAGQMSMLSAQVTFYDNRPAGPQETLFYVPPQPAFNPVFGVFIAFNPLTGRNDVMGASTDWVGPRTPTLAAAGGFSFFLEFGPELLPAVEAPPTESGLAFTSALTAADYQTARLATAICDGPCFPNTNNVSNPGLVRFTQVNPVPEPGSLALALIALGAGVVVRRKQRQA